MTLAQPQSTVPRPRVSPHGVICAVSMMKDEGPYLLEWVAHHLAVGFTRLVVYTNDCTDGTDLMLDRLEELGLAHHRANDIAPGTKPQPSAIGHAENETLVREADWVMVFDADEFLLLRHGDGTLDPLIDAIDAEGASGMVVTWRIFGSGGIVDWSRDPVTEAFVMAAPPMWNKGWGVKTLFRHDPEIWRLGIHRPKLRNRVLDTDYPHRVTWLNGSGRPMPDYFKFRGWRSIVRTVGYDWAQMNHYALKSVDAYALRRMRGNVNAKKNKYSADYWALQDRNEVRDEAMRAVAPRRRSVMAGLLADPVLARLHRAAVEGAEARLAEMKAAPGYADFVAALRRAGDVPITQVEAKPPKPRDRAAIAAKMKDVETRAATARDEDKARPPLRRDVTPVDVYVRDLPDMSAEPPMEWHRNHSVLLPADPRIFTPAALLQIAAGKFQRNLVRNLPGLLGRGARVVETGPVSGFAAAHLASVRPDVGWVLAEADPEARIAIARIRAANALAPPQMPPLPDPADGPSLAALMAEGCDCLILGDPATDAEALATALRRASPPGLVILNGRLWCRRFAERASFEAVLSRAGYAQRLHFDPMLVAAYRRAAE